MPLNSLGLQVERVTGAEVEPHVVVGVFIIPYSALIGYVAQQWPRSISRSDFAVSYNLGCNFDLTRVKQSARPPFT